MSTLLFNAINWYLIVNKQWSWNIAHLGKSYPICCTRAGNMATEKMRSMLDGKYENGKHLKRDVPGKT